MNRIDRLFGILTLLQSRKYVSGEKMSDKFHISIRTVYRDIKSLVELGIPVSFEQHKGYFIVQGYFLPPVSFTTDEANALLLIEGFVYGFADKSIQKNYSDALNKVKAVLRSVQKEHFESLEDKIKLQLPASLKHDYEYLSVLQNAIAEKHIVELSYKDFKEEITLRQIEPVGLIFYAFAWHLIAWCHLRKDNRDFKVSRILALKDTGLPFKISGHITVNDYMKNLPVDY